MSMRNLPVAVCLLGLTLATDVGWAGGPNLGKPIDPADIAAWDISILPDGTGLPRGTGTAGEGARVYAEKCAMCHGENGRPGGPNAPVVGGGPLDRMEAAKTVANFWPYATTVFDFIRRAMPWQQPRSLTDDEVYSLTAFILAENKIIGQADVMNAETLPKVQMPNRDGFIIRFPDKI